METVILFGLERAILNFFPIIIGSTLVAWLFGDRLRSLAGAVRSLIYALAGTVSGLISYWSFDFAQDGYYPFAFAIVAASISTVSFAIIFPIVFICSQLRRRRKVSEN